MRKDAAIGLSYSRELQAAMEERLGFRDLGFWSEAEASRGREGWRMKERGKAGLAALRKLAACFMHRAKAGRAAGREREKRARCLHRSTRVCMNGLDWGEEQ